MDSPKSSEKEKMEQASSHSKGSIKRRPANVRIVQNVLLVWLDQNIDDNNVECQNTVKQLRRFVDNINTFTDGSQCAQFIKTITDNQVCMIIRCTWTKHCALCSQYAPSGFHFSYL
jgi:hypothetical protein